MTTPCKYRHEYHFVSNPYKDGVPSPDTFEGAEWRTERRCKKCDVLLEGKHKVI